MLILKWRRHQYVYQGMRTQVEQVVEMFVGIGYLRNERYLRHPTRLQNVKEWHGYVIDSNTTLWYA